MRTLVQGLGVVAFWTVTNVGVLASDTGALDAPSGYFDRAAEGWFWYAEPLVEAVVEVEPEAPIQASTAAAVSPPDPTTELAALQAELEQALAAAVLAPTEDNVRTYLALDHAARARAQRFSETWQQVLWGNPAFDHRLVRPVNDQAVQVYHDERVERVDATLRAAARDHGLFFFLSGSCPYCHRLAPVLAELAAHYGFEVVPVSLDGGGVPEFPHPRRNGALAERLGVTSVPAVFLARPRTRELHPVAHGYVGYLELAERLFTLLDGDGDASDSTAAGAL